MGQTSDSRICRLKIYLYGKICTNLSPDRSYRTCLDADHKALDRKALDMVRLSLTQSIAFNIAKEMTKAFLKEAPTIINENPSTMNKLYLMSHLFNLRITKVVFVVEHLN